MNSLADLLFSRISLYGKSFAIYNNVENINYETLNHQGLKIASCINSLGIRKETVGVVGQRKTSIYYSLLGILYAGASFTPLSVKYKESRLVDIIKQAKINYLIGELDDLIEIHKLLINKINLVYIINSKKKLQKLNFKHIYIEDYNDIIISKPIKSQSFDLTYLLFTSGTTGTPKGVKISNKNILSFLDNMSILYPLREGFIASQTFDLSFDPSVSDVFFTWAQGGTICILNEKEKVLPHEYIIRNNITFWNSVPTIAKFMYKMGILKPNIFPSLKYSMFCGEQFPKEIANAWKIAAPNSTIENLYGPTETTIYISRYELNYDRKNNFYNSILPIGKVFPNHEVSLIDVFNNKINKGKGELCFSGSQISDGYLNDQEKTKSKFVKFDWDTNNRLWYKTGDLGFINDQGNIECIGRIDSQIKLGGKRIEISEIECVLSKNSKLNDVVVVPIRDNNKIVVGIVAFTENVINEKLEQEILKKFQDQLDKTFFPKKIIQIKNIPLTVNGKIDRKNLEEKAKEQN
jgi:D-alanine--poly(phosphoribitol) ligase subunit 1